jgi:site-specific recombinase XerD
MPTKGSRPNKPRQSVQSSICKVLATDAPKEVEQFQVGRFKLDQNPAAVYVSTLSLKSRRVQMQALNVIASLLSGDRQDAINLHWWQLRYQHTAALRNILVEKYAPATANRMLAALKGCLKECLRLGLMSADDHARASDIKPVKSQTLPAGRALTATEIGALMKVCLNDSSPAGYRDVALIAIARAGLRRSEITKLEVKDFEPDTGALTIRGGKGRKDRIAYLSSGGTSAVDDWVKLRNDSLGTSEGALLVAVDRYGHINSSSKHLADQTVLDILKKRADQVGIERFSPHDFRRTFISDLLDAGADIVTVQKLAGHANTDTTARYDRRGEATKRTAAKLIDLPYQR